MLLAEEMGIVKLILHMVLAYSSLTTAWMVSLKFGYS